MCKRLHQPYQYQWNIKQLLSAYLLLLTFLSSNTCDGRSHKRHHIDTPFKSERLHAHKRYHINTPVKSNTLKTHKRHHINIPLKSDALNAHKRQYVDSPMQGEMPLQIDHWSGPFFNDNEQASAFKQLASGDVTGSKRMSLEGIDPTRLLTPLPIKEKPKIVKDEGPIAEAYEGENPYPDKIAEVSPQERLAGLVSEPIIDKEPYHARRKNELRLAQPLIHETQPPIHETQPRFDDAQLRIENTRLRSENTRLLLESSRPSLENTQFKPNYRSNLENTQFKPNYRSNLENTQFKPNYRSSLESTQFKPSFESKHYFKHDNMLDKVNPLEDHKLPREQRNYFRGEKIYEPNHMLRQKEGYKPIAIDPKINGKFEQDYRNHNFEHKSYPMSHFMREKPNERINMQGRSSDMQGRASDILEHKHETSRMFDEKPEERESMFQRKLENKEGEFENKPEFRNEHFQHPSDFKSNMFHERPNNNYGNEDTLHHRASYEEHDRSRHYDEDKPLVTQDDSFNHLETHSDPVNFGDDIKSKNQEPAEKMISQFEEREKSEYENAMKEDRANQENDEISNGEERDIDHTDEPRGEEMEENEHEEGHEEGHEESHEEGHEEKRSNIKQFKKKLERLFRHVHAKKESILTNHKHKHVVKNFMDAINAPLPSRDELPSMERNDVNKIKSPEDELKTTEKNKDNPLKDSGTLKTVPLNDEASVANTMINGEAIFQSPDNFGSDNNSKEELDNETIFLHHHKKVDSDTTKEFKKRKHIENVKILNIHKTKSNTKRSKHLKHKAKKTIKIPTKFKKTISSIKRANITQPIINNTSEEEDEQTKRSHYNYMGVHHHGKFFGESMGPYHRSRNRYYTGVVRGTTQISDREYAAGHHGRNIGYHNSYPGSRTVDYMEQPSAIGRPVTGSGRSSGHGLFGNDPVHSLQVSDAHTDHETAGIIDAIWEHDYEARANRGRHHGKAGVMGFFGHTDQNALLPAETLDGIAEHWEQEGHHPANGRMYSSGDPLSQATKMHNAEVVHQRLGAIQDIQDDPNIDSELQNLGIGMPLNGHRAHHNFHLHNHHRNGYGLPYMESHEVTPYHDQFHNPHVVPTALEEFQLHSGRPLSMDVTHHPEMSSDEYHNHIDNLMMKYRQLETDMKDANGGGLMDHLNEHMLHAHHPSPHPNVDVYAYKNPWDNARVPYHVPVENHPVDSHAVAPATVPFQGDGPRIEGKTEAKVDMEPKVEVKMDPRIEGKGEEEAKVEAAKLQAKGEEEAKLEAAKLQAKGEEEAKLEAAKLQAKGEEEAKLEAAKLQAIVESKEAPQPVALNKSPDKEEKQDTMKAPDETSKMPSQQRSGAEESESNDNSTIISEAIQKNIKEGDSSTLLQAISAYKSLNMTVPPSLQIAELKEELREAKERTKAVELVNIKGDSKTEATPGNSVASQLSQSKVMEPSQLLKLPQVNPTVTQTVANPSLPSAMLHETAATKTKEPTKNVVELVKTVKTTKPITGTGDLTKALQDLGNKESSVKPASASLTKQKLQELNLAQQALKEVLLNAANVAKQTKKPSVEQEKVSAAKQILESSTKDKDAQEAPLMALIKTLEQEKNKQNVPLTGSVQVPNGVAGVSKVESKPSLNIPSLLPGVQNPVLSNVLNELMSKTNKHNNKSTATTTSSVEKPDDSDEDFDNAPSLELSDDEKGFIGKTNDKQDGLVTILNSVGLLKKDKHKNDSPYARIGYEQAAPDGEGASKKDISSVVNTVKITPAVEIARDAAMKFRTVENLSWNEEEETSKKNKIKNKRKSRIAS